MKSEKAMKIFLSAFEAEMEKDGGFEAALKKVAEKDRLRLSEASEYGF